MKKLFDTNGYKIISEFLTHKGFQPFAFQEQTWQAITNNKSGLVNAPTGCGKTFSVFLGAIIQFINEHPKDYQTKNKNGLQLLWITPLRALAKDIARAMEEVFFDLNLQWKVGVRNGDTEISEREKQKRNMPEVLLITPESLHLLLAQKNYPDIFESLRIIAVDEWHELLGSKRGVQVELAISRLVNVVENQNSKVKIQNEENPKIENRNLKSKNIQQTIINNQYSTKNKTAKQQHNKTSNIQHSTSSFQLLLWGISATIGNLEEAKDVLLAAFSVRRNAGNEVIIKAKLDKKIEVISIIPEEIEKYPWAGHLGLKLAETVPPIIAQSNTTLVFINTRGMSERWYQTLLNIAPELAGTMALHHGSIERELRNWVEEALHIEKLKAVVCTASLDLGVDFRPVDTVIQVGSPKGVSRFLQRAGRSGHRPGEVSKIYFLPTHSLELVEAAALKKAIKKNIIESKIPLLLCFDVLVQYLCTLAVGEGFRAEEIYEEIKSTYCFSQINQNEWNDILQHITNGGEALQQYDEYKKVEVENGFYKIRNRRIAMRHRLHIGTIVSDAMLKVKYLSGGYIGVIEEWFISRLEPGDVFTFAGKNLELIMVKDMDVLVRNSSSKKSIVPSWQGGRMSLTANLGHVLRETFTNALHDNEPELVSLRPLFELQRSLSHLPKENEVLIEQIESKDGFHLLVYPFEGRQVLEAMSAIIAYRIGKITPISFSIAMNDYGFELLSDQPIPVDDTNVYELFTTENLLNDIQRSVNSSEMAARKFRDIAVIGGLIFQGYPGEHKKAKHLQSSAGLIFRVLSEYEPNNILLLQAYKEVLEQQMEELRLRTALERIQQSKIIITFPERLTPFSFPIIVDGLSRNNLSSEKLEDRIQRMQKQLERE